MGFFSGVSKLSQLVMATSTNPAVDAAVTTAIVDVYSGIIITLSAGGNTQTIQSPTVVTAGKVFTVVNNDTSGVNTIAVNGITLAAGKAQSFIWDGTAWGPTDLGITQIPVTIAQGGTGSATRGTAVTALLPYVQADTGATYTHSATGTTYVVNSASSQTITTPVASSGDIGCWFEVLKIGAGPVVITATTPATIADSSAAGSITCSDAEQASIRIKVVAANVYAVEFATNTWVTA